MGVLDKIKNALFEVEYVEVEEPPKAEKKSRVKDEKPIAKKIVLPGKKEEKIEELKEEELRDEDFEIRPKNEILKEKPHEEFKFMDDNDFKVDDYETSEPQILQVIDHKDDVQSKKSDNNYSDEIIEAKHSQDFVLNQESKPYGMDQSYNISVHPYGTYEKKEEKGYFKPSPIISPIYGILDKNYKKEDVKEKRGVRLSNYSRGNISVDDIRNKAYGDGNKEQEEIKFEVEEDDSDNLLVDLSDRTKPEVKELTMGDALEYFQDLGLEYNVDYVDVSKEKANTKKENLDSSISNQEDLKKSDENTDDTNSSLNSSNVVQIKEDSTDIINDDNDNDNLFDLIDSMYKEDE